MDVKGEHLPFACFRTGLEKVQRARLWQFERFGDKRRHRSACRRGQGLDDNNQKTSEVRCLGPTRLLLSVNW